MFLGQAETWLVCAREGGVFGPPEGGWGRGGLEKGLSRQASPKRPVQTTKMTHHLGRKAVWRCFFQKTSPYDTHLTMISALWGSL